MNNFDFKNEAEILRQKAEENLFQKHQLNDSFSTEQDNLKLIHELEVHQIELEMQYEELKREKELSREAADKYTELYDFAPSGYITLSEEGEILELNLKASQMLGNDRSHIKNRHFGFFLTDATRPVFYTFFENIFKGGLKSYCEAELVSDIIIPKWIHIEGDLSEDNRECFISIIDISDRKQAEDALRQSEEKLAELNSSKDKFFSIIAHDLRGPFGGFLNLTKIIAEDIENLSLNDIETMSKELQNSAANLFKLLENLLQWSKIQRGLIEFNPVICSIPLIINQNISLIKPTAKLKEITIETYFPENCEVIADGQMLDLIIRNLLTNAVKYTNHGGTIEVGFKAEPTGNTITSDGYVGIYVRDNGVGIPELYINKLFKIGEKVKTIGTDGELSTGLGLILCKEFVDLHNGRIWVESEEGRGSTFYITLPK